MNDSSLTRPSLLIRIRDSGNHRAWEEFVQIYADETAVVFVRNQPEYQPIITKAKHNRLLPPRRDAGYHEFPA